MYINIFTLNTLDKKSFDHLLSCGYSRFKLRAFICSHSTGYYWPGNPTSSSKCLLGPHKHVWYILQ